MGWNDREKCPPPEDGTKITVCWAGDRDYWPTTASFRTFHPNAKGKMTWRDGAGCKIGFTHWWALFDAPKAVEG